MVRKTRPDESIKWDGAVLADADALIQGNRGAVAVGTTMPDGSIYAGESPDTGKPMYSTPRDVRAVLSFGEAATYAGMLEAHGHKDWRVPTKDELNVLFENRAAIGGFNMTGSDPVGWYWSSSRWDLTRRSRIWAQCFANGRQGVYDSGRWSALRCIRG